MSRVNTTTLPHFEVGLHALMEVALFDGVPAELLAHLLLRAKFQELHSGDRLLYEGLADQGIWVVTEGMSSAFIGNKKDESVCAPAVWGEYASVAGDDCEIGVRVTGELASAWFIQQGILDSWLADSPDATKKMGANLATLIEGLNQQERDFQAKEGGVDQLLDGLQSVNRRLDELVPEGEVETFQRRYLIAAFDLECLAGPPDVTCEVMEQYYLVVDDDREVRMRSTDDHAFRLSLKRKSEGEVTVAADEQLYRELRRFQVGRTIRKSRYSFRKEPSKGWSLDVYDDESPFRGMIVAEVDLPDGSSREPRLPDELQVVEDISELRDFENRNLALFGPPDVFLNS